ncbi:MAG: peptidase C39 family protein [Propionibacteriales bacterium]|nr:peptidase C39 family protein [Propionibacteriales bacterium]
MHLPLSHWPDPRARIARALAYPRVAVSLVALAALLVGLLVVQPDLGRKPADALSLAATTALPSDYRQVSTAPIRFTAAAGTRTFGGRSYEYATWTSGWTSPATTFTQLVPSWNASTPVGSWVQVLVQVRDTAAKTSTVKDLGRWTLPDSGLKRSSAGAQSDAVARVATDTLVSTGKPLRSYRLFVKLMRTAGGSAPVVTSLGAVTSTPSTTLPPTSTPLRTTAVALAVPAYSQMTHVGQAPQYGGGGEAWCSPTSLAMVLGYYGRLPAASTYTWVPRSYSDRWVNHVARLTYDYAYEGTGNWPFNTAYAATRTGSAFVTRLASLRMAERFVRVGIPLVMSIKFSRGQLANAPISATAGHLVVLVGFTAAGNPIVNDPAAPRNGTVRRTYDRAQFEHAWLRGSAGMAYVVRDAKHPLPPRPSGVTNW